MLTSPCKNCKYRSLTCHDHCESYKQYREKVDKANANRRKETEATSYTINTIERNRKARNLESWMR